MMDNGATVVVLDQCIKRLTLIATERNVIASAERWFEAMGHDSGEPEEAALKVLYGAVAHLRETRSQ